MDSVSEYEKICRQNIAENKRILAELGFDKPFKPFFPKVAKDPPRKRKREEKTYQRKKQHAIELADADYEGGVRTRRSSRLSGKEPEPFKQLEDDIDIENERRSKYKPVRENSFGHIPGIHVGTTWLSRAECGADGVHRMTVAGIHGNATEGCYSVALSGGYEDDIDYGECFTYTGSGGRDLKGTKANPKNLRTAPQSKDQTLTKENAALVVSVTTRKPVRVIRGYKLRSEFAPEEGYRYDGLYTVEKYWQAVGASGFKVYKYALKRCTDQAPPPWKEESNDAIESDLDNVQKVTES